MAQTVQAGQQRSGALRAGQVRVGLDGLLAVPQLQAQLDGLRLCRHFLDRSRGSPESRHL
jgi:hypothetical protein